LTEFQFFVFSVLRFPPPRVDSPRFFLFFSVTVVSVAVACRNALLGLMFNIQLCDFGLSRQVHVGKDGSEYYAQSRDTPLPLRWYHQQWFLVISFGLSCIGRFVDHFAS